MSSAGYNSRNGRAGRKAPRTYPRDGADNTTARISLTAWLAKRETATGHMSLSQRNRAAFQEGRAEKSRSAQHKSTSPTQ